MKYLKVFLMYKWKSIHVYRVYTFHYNTYLRKPACKEGMLILPCGFGGFIP